MVKLSSKFKLQIRKKYLKLKKIVEPDLDKSIPPGYFDGTSQGHPAWCGAGAVLLISANHLYNIRYAPGRGSNTKAELSALWALLFMVNSLNLRKVQIPGYSYVVVEWVIGKGELQVVGLNPLFSELK